MYPVDVQPVIQTRRLKLRPFVPLDAPDLQQLAGERDIAATTLTIPHPYEEGMAEEWIQAGRKLFKAGEGARFAITRSVDNQVVGAVGLAISSANQSAELGYWTGKPFWNRGYATEAARAVLSYGFADLGLARIHAGFMAKNAPSGSVLEKLGMQREGRLRKHVLKWGEFHDLVVCGILAEEFRPEQ